MLPAIGLVNTLALAALAQASPAPALDLSNAVVVISPKATSIERLAARMLAEEAGKRGVKLGVVTTRGQGRAAILLGSSARPPSGVPASIRAPKAAEAYVIQSVASPGGSSLVALGHDEQGCMFAAGRLLRHIRFAGRRATAPSGSIRTAPKMPMRGHQLGWRPTANSYDRWGLKEFEQYIRDLIVWGTNAIELIPFDSGFPREENLRFTCRLADLIASYGLKVWLWYPIGEDVPPGFDRGSVGTNDMACPSTPEGRRLILQRRAELFSAMRHLDAVFIPGGDPGGCNCDRCRPWVRTLLPLARDTADVLHKHHPKAGLWLSNQGFLDEHNDAFYEYLRSERPHWLAGLVHGPWAEETVASMRSRAPTEYPIRQYPDICHCVRCQYPARDWDIAFALTLGREPPIYRPTEHAHIARMFQPLTCGAITYSDGINDDLNKVIWSAVLWDPGVSVDTVLSEYARCFFGDRWAARIGDGLRGLERSWQGPLLGNGVIASNHRLWAAIEKSAPDLAKNWRFQMALLRSVYDLYVQKKLEADLAADERALGVLRQVGSNRDAAPAAIAEAQRLLDEAAQAKPAPELRKRCMELGQALYDSIGMQLSVPLWGASGSERGAILDFLDVPLGDRDWLRSELGRLAMLSDPAAVVAGIDRITHWEDPGPGGFYDNLGDASRQPHLVHQKTWEEDPGYVESPRSDFAKVGSGARRSWVQYAETLFGAPIVMRYTGLDTDAQYVVRATYSGRYRPTMTLTANGTIQVHGPIASPNPVEPMEWPIPLEATRGGSLELRWDRTVGRGSQVSEVWLIRKAAAK